MSIYKAKHSVSCLNFFIHKSFPIMKFKFLSLILFVGLVFASCSKKDDFDKDEEWDKKECIYLLFPQTWTMPDATSVTLVDKEDSALKDWYIANSDVEDKPELAYPVDIKNQKEEVQTINNEEEMIAAKEGCEEYDKKECIYLLFPQTWVLSDGYAITLADKEDSALKDWYIANPNSEEKPELAYPVDIKNQKAEVQTVNNEVEMMTAKKGCEDYYEKECIYILFPQTWTLPDASEVTLADKEDVTLKDWYIANPESEEKPELAYPVDVKNKAGEVLTINNKEEMIAAKKNC